MLSTNSRNIHNSNQFLHKDPINIKHNNYNAFKKNSLINKTMKIMKMKITLVTINNTMVPNLIMKKVLTHITNKNNKLNSMLSSNYIKTNNIEFQCFPILHKEVIFHQILIQDHQYTQALAQ